MTLYHSRVTSTLCKLGYILQNPRLLTQCRGTTCGFEHPKSLYRAQWINSTTPIFYTVLYDVYGVSLRSLISLRYVQQCNDKEIVKELVEQGIPIKVAKNNLKRVKYDIAKELAKCKADAAKKTQQPSSTEPAVVFVGSEDGGEAHKSDERLAFELSPFGVVYPKTSETGPLDW